MSRFTSRSTPGGSLPISGGADAFVTELAPDGLSLEASTCLGGLGNDYATAIARGSAGSIYITGFTDSGDFPTNGPAQAALAGGIRRPETPKTSLATLASLMFAVSSTARRRFRSDVPLSTSLRR